MVHELKAAAAHGKRGENNRKTSNMTMGEESPVTSLVLPVLIRPILSKVCVDKMHLIIRTFELGYLPALF